MDNKDIEKENSNSTEKSEETKKTFPVHLIAINFALFGIIISCIFSINSLLYSRVISSTVKHAKKAAKESVDDIGLETIQELKTSRQKNGIYYFEKSAKSMKNQLTKIYKSYNLSSPPAIYAKSDKHEDFMYVLSSAQNKAQAMDIYAIHESIKKAYENREIASIVKENQISGISRPTILSTAPFKDKNGKVYGVLMMEFDISKEMKTANSSKNLTYIVGAIIYLSLFTIFNAALRSRAVKSPTNNKTGRKSEQAA